MRLKVQDLSRKSNSDEPIGRQYTVEKLTVLGFVISCILCVERCELGTDGKPLSLDSLLKVAVDLEDDFGFRFFDMRPLWHAIQYMP